MEVVLHPVQDLLALHLLHVPADQRDVVLEVRSLPTDYVPLLLQVDEGLLGGGEQIGVAVAATQNDSREHTHHSTHCREDRVALELSMHIA